MTDQSTRPPMGFGAILAAVPVLVALWPQVQPILDWLLLNFGFIVLHSQAQALFFGIGIGGGLAWRLAYHLPPEWAKSLTRTRIVIYCSVLTLLVSFGFQQTLSGLGFAVVAAIFGPVLLLYLIDLVYAWLPHTKPGSLE